MAATTDRHTRHNPSHPQTLAGPRVSPAAHRFVNFTHNRHCGPPPASNITTGDLQNAPAPASYSHRHLATLLNHDPAEMPRLFGGFGLSSIRACALLPSGVSLVTASPVDPAPGSMFRTTPSTSTPSSSTPMPCICTQNKPLTQRLRARPCRIRRLALDGRVGINGEPSRSSTGTVFWFVGSLPILFNCSLPYLQNLPETGTSGSTAPQVRIPPARTSPRQWLA